MADTDKKILKIKDKEVLTTYEVAKCLNVFTNTVINWMNTGKLNGYKTPGGHRRIPREEFEKFVKDNNLNVSIEFSGKKKILIVEDDEDAMELYSNIFKDSDYNIQKVYTGFSAGITATFKPDLILLDIMLPDLDGLEVCRLIKQDEELASSKILVISALKDESTIEKMYELGINDYLVKPFSVPEFKKKVEALLN
ncbi:MAG: response regulator [Fibrobacterota bacterium]